MKAIGRNVTGVQGDVAKLADLDRLYETVRMKGRIDIVTLTQALLNLLPWEASEELPGFVLWKGLKSIGVVTSPCLRDGKTTVEAHSSSSNLKVDVEQFARAVRGHWSIENGCHWSLDRTFREDESRLRERHLRENFCIGSA